MLLTVRLKICKLKTFFSLKILELLSIVILKKFKFPEIFKAEFSRFKKLLKAVNVTFDKTK